MYFKLKLHFSLKLQIISEFTVSVRYLREELTQTVDLGILIWLSLLPFKCWDPCHLLSRHMHILSICHQPLNKTTTRGWMNKHSIQIHLNNIKKENFCDLPQNDLFYICMMNEILSWVNWVCLTDVIYDRIQSYHFAFTFLVMWGFTFCQRWRKRSGSSKWR